MKTLAIIQISIVAGMFGLGIPQTHAFKRFRRALKQSRRSSMHKQAGYQSAKALDGFIAILHGTPVVEVSGSARGRVVTLNSGGWFTRATVKAMNAGLKEAGLTAIKVRLQGGSLVVDFNGETLDIGDSRMIVYGPSV